MRGVWGIGVRSAVAIAAVCVVVAGGTWAPLDRGRTVRGGRRSIPWGS
jgi:hypothetical protein